jgi:hypothetical protein
MKNLHKFSAFRLVSASIAGEGLLPLVDMHRLPANRAVRPFRILPSMNFQQRTVGRRPGISGGVYYFWFSRSGSRHQIHSSGIWSHSLPSCLLPDTYQIPIQNSDNSMFFPYFVSGPEYGLRQYMVVGSDRPFLWIPTSTVGEIGCVSPLETVLYPQGLVHSILYRFSYRTTKKNASSTK